MILKLKNWKFKLEQLRIGLIAWRQSSKKLLRHQLDMMQSSEEFIKSGENIENIIKEIKGISNIQLFKSNDVSNLTSKHKFDDVINSFKLLLKMEIRD